MAKDISETEYWKEIRGVAREIVQDCLTERYGNYPVSKEAEEDVDLDDVRECAFEKAWETVDGHQWIIYYAYNLDVIKHTRNEEAWEDVGAGEQFAGKSFDEIGTIVAFYAMLRDVEEEIGKEIERLEEVFI